MKKLILTLAALAMASTSQAAFLFCGSNINTVTNQVTTNPTNVNCGSIDAGAGNLITNVAIRLLGSFNDTVAGNNQVQFDATGPLGTTHSIQTAIAPFSGDNGGPSSGGFVAVGTQTLAASVVAVTTSNLGGLPTPDNTSIAVWLEYNTAPVQTGVPEPSTMALLGSALVGLGVISRRKK